MQATAVRADAALAADLCALVAHVHKNCSADLFEAVGGLELTLTQMKLLHRLEETGEEHSLKQAAEQIHVSLAATSRLVDELVRRGLVERREDLEDRRMKRVRITPAGHAVIATLNAARLKGLESFVATLDDHEREELSHVLATLLERPEVAACRIEAATS
jgi:DNA-binding MarR family transcriptional regulator